MSNESSLHKAITTQEQGDKFMKDLRELQSPSPALAELQAENDRLLKLLEEQFKGCERATCKLAGINWNEDLEKELDTYWNQFKQSNNIK